MLNGRKCYEVPAFVRIFAVTPNLSESRLFTCPNRSFSMLSLVRIVYCYLKLVNFLVYRSARDLYNLFDITEFRSKGWYINGFTL